MDFTTWEPVYGRILDDFGIRPNRPPRVRDEKWNFAPGTVYEAILDDFGYPRDGDERACDRFVELLGDDRTYDPASLGLDGAAVAVAGAGPSLESEADRAADADVVLAASTAADRLRAEGVAIDAWSRIWTRRRRRAGTTAAGTPVVAHAHGDNIPALETHIPAYDSESSADDAGGSRLARRQLGRLHRRRPGGLHRRRTRGEAARLRRLGLRRPDRDGEKRRKLRWAERLLRWLEQRRGERFDVLDGRRDDIEPVATD